MSDFVFTSRRAEDGELSGILRRYLAPSGCVVEELHGTWGSIAVAVPPHDRAVVGGSPLAPTILVGRPFVRAAGSAPRIVTEGRARGAVDALLREGDDVGWDERLDGPFALLEILRGGGGRVVTDIAGFIPVFTARSAGPRELGLVLGTHLDVVAVAAGRGRAIDETSAADLLVNLTCTFPFTIFDGVEQLPPASAGRFGSGGDWAGRARPYWVPTEERRHARLADAADALRHAIVENVRIACDGSDRVGVLLSGGEDARTVLAAIPDGTTARAFVFADWESREVSIARRVARAYGAGLTVGWRSAGHYVDPMEAVAGLVGSGQLFMDVHGFGFHETLGIRELPVVLGGLSADAFLKAAHAPAGAPPPGLRRGSGDPIRGELLDAVLARRMAFREALAEIRPETAPEWERLWPFSMRMHAANFHGNRRLFASHEPFHANAIVKLAAAAPVGWKRRRALFQRAVRPLLAASWHIPHSRWHYPYFGALVNVPLAAGLRVSRGMAALLRGQVRASHGPWPKWHRVVRLPQTARKMADHPVWESPLRPLFDAGSPEDLASSVRGDWHPLREMMLLQLAYLTREAAGA